MEQFIAGPGRAHTRFGEVPRYREGLYRVGSSCYAWLVPNGSWGETNLGLIVCGSQSVLVDTCWDLRFTREALGAASRLLDGAPIEYVVNTHSDGDHCWGNQLFADKPIIATEACARQFDHHKPEQVRALSTACKHAAALRFAGLDAFGHYVHQMFAPYDFRDVKLTPPNQPFNGERTLRVGDVELVIYEVGPGHTQGDCIVFVPEQRVVYAADILFVEATPVAWAGPVDNLVAALKRLIALEARVIVPGHGRLATASDVQRVIDYWEFVQDQLWTRFREGMPAHLAARDLILSPRFQTSQFARWDSPERLVTSAQTFYRGWGARSRFALGALGTLATLRQQAQLALALPASTPRIMHRFPQPRAAGEEPRSARTEAREGMRS